jgi:reactive chlorine resistance protein C
MAAGSNAFPAAILDAEPVVRSVGSIVARYGLAIVIGWIGIFKFYPYEAHNIQPLVSHSPFMGWLYSLFSVETFSLILGVVEVLTALLLVVKPWYPTVSLLGSVLAIVLFVSTLTFVITTPGVGEASAGGFPLLSMTGQFLIKVGCPAFSGLLNLRSLCGELRIQVFGADFAWCPVAECGVNSSLIVEQFDVAGNVLLRFLP